MEILTLFYSISEDVGMPKVLETIGVNEEDLIDNFIMAPNELLALVIKSYMHLSK